MLVYENEDGFVYRNIGSSDFTLITFSGFGEVGYYEAGSYSGEYLFRDSCKKLNLDTIGIVSKKRNWYRSKESLELIEFATNISDKKETIYTYGDSMGGYAALKYSKKFKASHSIALAPRWSLDIDEREGAASSYDAFFQPDMKGMGVRDEDFAENVYILYDEAVEEDKKHVDFYKKYTKNPIYIKVFYTGHVILFHIKGTENLRETLENIENPEKLRISFQKIRKASKDNHRNILNAALKKHPQLFEKALQSPRPTKSGITQEFMNRPDFQNMVFESLCQKNHVEDAIQRFTPTDILEPIKATGLSVIVSYGEFLTFNIEKREFSLTNKFKTQNNDYLILANVSEYSVDCMLFDELWNHVTTYDWLVPSIKLQKARGYTGLIVNNKFLSNHRDNRISHEDHFYEHEFFFHIVTRHSKKNQ